MDKQQLKTLVLAQVDAERGSILALGRQLYQTPETGYREHRTTETLCRALGALGLEVDRDIAVTGCRGYANRGKAGPRLAILGELDSVICHDHPDCDKQTGAVHACGHSIQTTVMYGVAAALVHSGALPSLDGAVDFMAVPAEEYIELEYRRTLREQGELYYFAGKPELVRRGAFDHVDICMMAHNFPIAQDGYKLSPKNIGNGFVSKQIAFAGIQAHAGAAPWDGVNALNMATLAINNINAQRETFREADCVRIHHIITKGGDITNAVPADVRMEMMVRAKNLPALLDACHKVNRSVQAAAIALGGHADIWDTPGYLPLQADDNLATLLTQNALQFYTPQQLLPCMESTASFDIGDLSLLLPVLHCISTGISGGLHTKDFRIIDEEDAYIIPVKLLCMTVIDLLFDGAEQANRVLAQFQPTLTKQEYLRTLQELEQQFHYS